MRTSFLVTPDGIYRAEQKINRKKLQRTNQGSNFVRGSFSNSDTVRILTQFGRETQLNCLKR